MFFGYLSGDGRAVVVCVFRTEDGIWEVIEEGGI